MTSQGIDTPKSSRSNNLVVHGNNDDVVRLLGERLHGKVQCLVIDPSYNTSRGKRSADAWKANLSEVLSATAGTVKPSGAVFIHTDDRKLSQVKTLAEETFGAENFLNMVILKTSDPSGLRSSNALPFNQTEYLLIFAKDRKQFTYFPQYVRAEYDPCYRNVVVNPSDPVSAWKVDSFPRYMANLLGYRSVRAARTELGVMFEKKLADYALENPDAVFQSTRVNDRAGAEIQKLAKKSLKRPKDVFYLAREQARDVFLRGGRQMTFYSNKVRSLNGEDTPTKMLTNLWTDIPFHGVGYEGEAAFSGGKKPERLVQRVLAMCSEPGDLVLDPYGGSGTTAAVAEKLDRRWVIIEQDKKLIEQVIVPRLTRVINGRDSTGLDRLIETKQGGSFERLCLKAGELEGRGLVLADA
jgi:adenine-specific DNA-methyltransferase